MEMNDNTILRIKVPAHLYEAVKARLTLNEAKGKHNLGAGMEVVKEKKSSGTNKPKKASAPKSEAPKKKANAPIRVTPDNEVKADKDVPGIGLTEKKKGRSLDELKAAHRMIGQMISEMEEEGKEPVEEGKQIEEGIKVTSLRDPIMRAMREYKRVTYNGKPLKALGYNDFTTQDGQKISFDSPEAGKLEIDGEFAQDIYDIVEPTPGDPKMQGMPDYLRYRGGD